MCAIEELEQPALCAFDDKEMVYRDEAKLQHFSDRRCDAAEPERLKSCYFLAARWMPARGRGLIGHPGFLCQSKRFQTCGLFTNGASLSFIFSHRLSTILRALFAPETVFCPLSGLI
jgi:hypothetical protein